MISRRKIKESIKLILNKKIYKGYTDSDLELLADPKNADTGNSLWVYWTSELYSFGRLYREWAYYPKCLPLFIYSDHGIQKKAELAEHEKNNNAKYHFTFNEERVLKNKEVKNKKIVCVPHPWVTYRRKNNITQLENAKGTLIFFAHSTGVTRLKGHDTDEYFDKLKQLPEKYQPVVVCMHMADILNGHHKKIRKHGIPIVTAGNTSSINFVDRFYNLVKNFNFASSNTPGSQMYYCAEMGIPYFLMGALPKHLNVSNPDFPPGEIVVLDTVHKDLQVIEKHLFYTKLDSVSLHQKIYVEWILGLNSKVSRLEVSWILWSEFFRNWWRWYYIFLSCLVWVLRKLGLFERVKKYYIQLRKKKK